MSSKSQTSFLLATIAGTILGGLLGYFLPELMLSFSFIGQLFVNALRIIVIPFVVASVIVGIAALAHIDRVSRSIGKSLLYFGVTSFIAVAIGFVLVIIIKPGAGLSASGAAAPAELTRAVSFSVSQVLGSILPESLLSAVTQGNLLGLILFALAMGITVIALEGKVQPVVVFFESLRELLARLVQFLLRVMPVGVLFLVATAVAENVHSSGRIFTSLGLFSLTVLAAFFVQGLVVLPAALKVLAKRPTWGYMGSTAPALFTAFGTGSATATLPITMDTVTERSDVDRRAGTVTLPLGAMVNMNGTALYLVIAAFFCAQASGVNLSILQMGGIVAMAFLLSLAASLIPHGSLLILGVLMFSVNLPPEAFAVIGLILAVDWFFERIRATLNVWGDVVGAAVIAETFEFKTARRVYPVETSRRQKPQKRDDSSRRRDQRPVQKDNRRPGQKDRQPAREPRKRGQRRDNRRHDGARTDRPERGRRFEEKKPAAADTRNQPDKRLASPMPTPPFHVLEGELKSRKTAPPSETEQPGSPSQQTIERERAKIAAQLAEMGQNQETLEDKTEIESPSSISTPYDSPEPENGRPEVPVVDYLSKQETTENESLEPTPEYETEESSEGQSDTATEGTSPAVFGRKKARRGAAMKSVVPSDDKPVEDAPPTTEFSPESMVFGRSKRKKPGA